MRIGRDVRDAITLPHSHRLQRRGPSVAALEKLLVRHPQVGVNDALAVSVQLAGAPRELERRQRRFHVLSFSL